ncbi:MAG: lysine biosynthesis protein LysX [Anaerolineales bacterium]
MRLGVLFTRLRIEEKWLFAALEARGLDHDRLPDSQASFDLASPEPWRVYDLVFVRSLSTTRGLYAAQTLNAWSVPTINAYPVMATCSDKAATMGALARANVPQPRAGLAFTPEAAVELGATLGYPYVVKPVQGSWGRMVARINDRDAAEAVFEQRKFLGDAGQQVYFLQEYIDKPGRDIRAFVVGDQTPVAIYRESEHWITNTARGAVASECPVTPELHTLCQAAATAVGGGVLAIDLLEDPVRGLLVNEVNHTMEFHSTVPLTGVDLPGLIVDYALRQAEQAMAVPASA